MDSKSLETEKNGFIVTVQMGNRMALTKDSDCGDRLPGTR